MLSHSFLSFCRGKILLLLGLAFCLEAIAYDYPVRVVRETKGRAIALTIVNDGPVPVNVVIELTQSVNTGFSPAVIGSKFPHLVHAGQSKLVTTAVPLKINKPGQFAFRYRYAFGDPLAAHSPDVTYRLPIPDETRAVVRSYTGAQFSNTIADTNNAAQIVVPKGTPIVAARSGVVINGRGFASHPSPTAWSPMGNFVSILHDDGTWATYGWLEDDSVIPSPGQIVTAGQPIAKSSSNPDSTESYILFVVNRNFFGLQLRGVPITFKAAGDTLITPTTFNGQVSPTLKPLYSPPADSTPWIPSEELLPSPKPPVIWDDEHLTPSQRQALFRQRMLQISDETSTDSVSGSRPLLFLALGSSIFATIAAILIISSHSSSKPAGVRGVIWNLLRGKPPTGVIPSEHAYQGDGVSLASRIIQSLSGPSPSPTSEPPPVSPALELPTSAKTPSDSKPPAAPNLSTDPPPTPAKETEPEPDLPQRQLLNVDRISLLSLINSALPPTHVATAKVQLSSVTDLFLAPDEAHLEIDYVILDASTGSPSAAILYAPADADQDTYRRVSQKLSLAGIPSLMFDALPKPSDLKARIKRVI